MFGGDSNVAPFGNIIAHCFGYELSANHSDVSQLNIKRDIENASNFCRIQFVTMLVKLADVLRKRLLGITRIHSFVGMRISDHWLQRVF